MKDGSSNLPVSTKYRCAVIGCGWIGVGVSKEGFTRDDNHAHAYRGCDKTELVALCDKVRGFDYDNYLEMVKKESLDIVSVCTPPETHCQIVCDIAPYVKGIYCEKPIATTLEDADKMIETCHKHGIVLQINHPRRFYKPKFRFSRGILDTGTHAFDLINYLFRPEIQVDIEYVDTTDLTWEESHIFELDCTQSNNPNYKAVPIQAVEHLIDCIEHKHESISSGEEARRSLVQCLEMLKQ